MAIPEETVRQVREATDIVELVSEYVSLKRKGGKNYFGLCPFHQEKTPSFSVHPDRQIFHCFGCGKGGNVFTFLMEVERIDFPDAVRHLADRARIEIRESGKPSSGQNEELYRANELAFKFYRYRLNQTETEDVLDTRNYLRSRGISEEIEERFELGLSPAGWDGFKKIAEGRDFRPETLERAGLLIKSEKGGWYDRFRERLMFPIRNAGGRVVGFGARILKEDPDNTSPKYINSPETAIYQKGRMLYGLPQSRDTIRSTGEAVLVEGYTDLIALHRVGLTNSVATLGTALTSEQAALIKRFANRVTLLYDADEAGGNAAFRGADILVGAGLEVFIALLPDGEDPDSLAGSGGREAVEKILGSAESLVDFKIEYFRRNGSLTTPQGQGEATKALIETIRRIPDPITRQFALHEASEKLGIDERVLGRELQQVRSPGPGQSAVIQAEPTAPSALDRMVQDLLWVLIRHPEHCGETFNNIHSADIGEHPLRPVFDKIEAAWIEGSQFSEADLYDTLNDRQDVLPMLNTVLTRSQPDDPDFPLTVVKKAPLVMRRQTLRSELSLLRGKMKSGGKTELVAKYQELKTELNEIEHRLSIAE